ncbi:hypothetical protein BC567DRAFT_239263 [Phyllosticta citribraziliensis]
MDQPISGSLRSEKEAEEFHSTMANIFLRSSAAFMMKDLYENEQDNRKQDLCMLVTRAANVYGRLQTQRVYYSWMEPADLIGVDFFIASPYLRADRLHKIDEDEGETTMDGARVKIVLSPVVLAHGNSHGEDYERHRVIAKAVVYFWRHSLASVEAADHRNSRTFRHQGL